MDRSKAILEISSATPQKGDSDWQMYITAVVDYRKQTVIGGFNTMGLRGTWISDAMGHNGQKNIKAP